MLILFQPFPHYNYLILYFFFFIHQQKHAFIKGRDARNNFDAKRWVTTILQEMEQPGSNKYNFDR